MPTSQMNVRIDDDVRIKGNAAFESIGWTPSQAAREFWSYAARNRQNHEELQKMRQLLENDNPEAEQPSWTEEGANIVSKGLAKLGIAVSACKPSELPYEELREQALYDRLQEKGLL